MGFDIESNSFSLMENVYISKKVIAEKKGG